MVVYRVSPPDVESAVRVGEFTYPGFSNTAAGLARSGIESGVFRPALQPVADTPMEIVAQDVAGNQTRSQFEHRVFPKKFRSSRIPLDDKFLGRVVPAILQSSPQVQASA